VTVPDIQKTNSNKTSRTATRGGDTAKSTGRSARSPGRRSKGTVTDRVFVGFDLAFVILLGALHALPTAWPRFWWLQLLCAAGLAFRVSRASVGRSALLGFAFGTAWLCAGTWWLYVSMHRYGGLSAPLSALAVFALSAFLSLYLAAAMGLFAKFRRHALWLDVPMFAGCWLLAELARGFILTGFPWAASGYAHVDSPLAALAPVIGVYGIGAVAAGLSALLVTGLRDRHQPGGVAAVCVATVGVVLAGLAFIKWPGYTVPTGTLQLSLLQPNVPQNEKFAVEVLPQNLEWAAKNLVAARGDLVIAPETIVPLLPEQLPPEYWQPLLKHFQRGPQAALFGRPLGSLETSYTNSAVGISRDTVKTADGFYRYDKHHLVPFGEFIPTGFRWFTNLMNIPLGDFGRGPRVAPSFPVKGERVAPNICFEDLFGEELAARFADEPVAPTVFANLTNIGWFGDTIAVDQHLHISRMRTLEFQRPMVRATNTGTTAVIDHTGRVTQAMPTFTQGVLEAPVTGRSGLTPFASWSARFGLLPLLIVALLPLLGALVLRRADD
jgi:apolipoprotein N-acyltransferase